MANELFPKLQNLNPQGSNYAANHTHSTTDLINKALQYQIFDLAPARWNALKILNLLPFVEVGSDEFDYKEKVWGRSHLTVNSYDGATNTITLTHAAAAYDNYFPIRVNTKILNPSGVPYLVKSLSVSTISNHTTITITEENDASPSTIATAFSAGDKITIQNDLKADGMDKFASATRPEYASRYNYVEEFERTCSWTRLELAKMKNQGTTDALQMYEFEEKLEQLRLDLFSTAFAGKRAEFDVFKPGSVSTTYKAKTTNGIFNMMVDGGSSHASPTLSGLQSAFESLAFSTQKKAIGGKRFIMARAELITELNKLYKDDKTRYAPNDMIAKLDLDMYNFGGGQYIPMPVELFSEDSGALPPAWNDRILVLDLATIKRNKIRNIPAFEKFMTDDVTRGSQDDTTIWAARAYMGLQMNQVQGSFYMDVQ